MKIMTIAGTRPELIRLSRIIKQLDFCFGKDHILVWTGQNYDPNLSDIFFKELEIRHPDYYFKGSPMSVSQQMYSIFSLVERAIDERKPDKALILGDTNSALSAILCEKKGVPVYHMEAGNRCFDKKVPEEMNRRVIDGASSFNLPYVPNSAQNLYNENTPSTVIVTGNPIKEVINYYGYLRDDFDCLQDYAVMTIHRAENVDVKERLQEIFLGVKDLNMPIVYPVHPRTKQKIEQFQIVIPENVAMVEPMGFFDFLNLEENANIALTDSGTVQEECCLFHVPTVTIRDTTERPETVWCGSNIVTGINKEKIAEGIEKMLSISTDWELPEGYDVDSVSSTVIDILKR